MLLVASLFPYSAPSNGQLLKITLERKLLVEQPSDPDGRTRNKPAENFKYSCGLLKKLMTWLPPRNLVFLYLDSIILTASDKSLADDLAEKISRIGRRSAKIVVKQFQCITDSVPISHFRRVANFSLHVSDDFDGWQCGMYMESTKRKNALKLKGLEELQESEGA